MGAGISLPGLSTLSGRQESSNISQAAEYVRTIIKQNCVVIFSKTDCPYSKKAKKIFDKMGITYYTVELNQRNDGEVLQSALFAISGAKTVPRVFINGSCIGGGMDTEKLYQQGKLESLLDQCTIQSNHLQMDQNKK